ncbi:hypothetical protein M406DRAFT_59909 [Cryphonectria parasitica EP155]|uniref:Polyketide synthase n=1 Tax=Cryphonectria parasitica (strain ATCC 38755 / EP155) TaxID=660469 RepID=A0A9P4YCV1_CRYP1|nr:uncharacterized protein M406DRAFT_59909 [Cryphonectria parasitica EP155]KAF3771157.1 hypothetical protein M406DRAFT_59909 [Cryphonectria parasitica EP155]
MATTSPQRERMNQLRSAILTRPALHWVADVLANLRHQWDTITESVPELQDYAGGELLDDLHEWVRTGVFPQGTHAFPLPNILLTPLVVITHLAQYWSFKERAGAAASPPSQQRRSETLGLCTGILSAAAVSSAANDAQLQRFGAVAVRLAMVIGALVDAQDFDGKGQAKWSVFSAVWTSADLDGVLEAVLPEYPEAYTSVLPDERRATITCHRTDVDSLQERLKSAGLSTTNLSLRGSFHNASNTSLAESLIHFADRHRDFQFPDIAELVLPTRLDSGGSDYSVTTTRTKTRPGSLHEKVVHSMLTEQANWQQAFKGLLKQQQTPKVAVSFGLERCVPGWLSRKLGARLVQITSLDELSAEEKDKLSNTLWPGGVASDDAVAVVGMSCLLPGAPDLDGFWDILCAGKSQHKEAPSDRFFFETAWREADPQRKWYGNFLEDYDTFDHKFFKKSPREMASTDPQHRLILQAAYQAIEQSGYFNNPTEDKHIGCYVGVGLVDYENNIACHPAGAFAATGNLKSFAAGKISHYFGWTGPGLTIDTACSSSAVAVHTACRAILSGECSGALAGGVNVMTSPEWFQNLAGASFLSTTGQCKPFDIDADGYCRAEAVGAVYLKRLSTAIADGNQILGIVASSGVYQNENCTAITVPNAPSLSGLFRDVVNRAGLEPRQVSVVEAHGTGTPVGDPAEYDSVRRVFGGSSRSGGNALSLSSVKGLLGHSESASGIVALLKVLLMITKRAIPPQASFKTINPSIHATPADNIEIPTSVRPWDVEYRAALINNYGASGSNASLVITQGPTTRESTERSMARSGLQNARYPFWLTGFDRRSLRAYSTRLLQFLTSQEGAARSLAPTLADLSFQVSRQSNRTLPQSLIFSSSSIEDLKERLTGFVKGDDKILVPTPRHQDSQPVVLCFGGQISTFVGLDRDVYDSIKILRKNLDEVNDVCISLGLDSIYPTFFQKTPIHNTVGLQTALFAMQYSCARTWIDCGVKVSAVVGHSFGELTAMCVSGVLSLNDAVKLVAGRARIIQDQWPAERGAMMAIEGDLEDVQRLLAEASDKTPREAAATIACFNGPRSFTLAGSAAAIDTVLEIVADKNNMYNSAASVKTKRLDVSHAFHSTLVDNIVPALKKLGRKLILRNPVIPLERAVPDDEANSALTVDFVSAHMRNPVYFHHAVHRLAQKYPEGCIWLEAGSNSTITMMAGRALGLPKSSSSSSLFQAVNITSNNSFRYLAETTTNLWQAGLAVSFWAHHASQSSEYPIHLLPPYQFEKAKHWMDLKKPVKAVLQDSLSPPAGAPQNPPFGSIPNGVWTFMGYQDSKESRARFRINTNTAEYEKYVSAHVIAETAPICPSTYQLVIAIDALASLTGDPKCKRIKPRLQGMVSHSPMVMGSSQLYWLDAEREQADPNTWTWKIVGESNSSSSRSGSSNPTTLFVAGCLEFKPAQEIEQEMLRYQRLVQHERSLVLLDGSAAEGAIVGSRNIYRAFSSIVQYKHQIYRGLQRLACRGTESAGRVKQAHTADKWLDLGLADGFCQVAGIYLNSMADSSAADEDTMFISDCIDSWIRSPKLDYDDEELHPVAVWDILACHSRPSDAECTSDVFVFDHETGELVEVILGIHYVRVARGMVPKVNGHNGPSEAILNGHSKPEKKEKKSQKTKSTTRPDITDQVRDLVCNLSGLEPEEVQLSSKLVDLGIDSLMGMELATEVQNLFRCSLDMSDLLEVTDFRSLITCINKAIGPGDASVEEDDNDDYDEAEDAEVPQINGDNNSFHANGQTNGGIAVNGYTSEDVNGLHTTDTEDLTSIPISVLLDAFDDTKSATDRFIQESGFSDYVDQILPKSDELCVVHILDAFDQLGCPLRDAKPGQVLERIEYLPRHEQFVEFIYDLLQTSGLVELKKSGGDNIRIIRTSKRPPQKTAALLLEELIQDNPIHVYDHRLTYLTGCKLADCLVGKADGLQLVFASAEGREVVSGMYGKSPINVAWIRQMEHLLREFFLRLPSRQQQQRNQGPIEILEMGAGTGGTTANLIPVLEGLGVPFRYTVTDLSPSLVAAARKRFKGKKFMNFQVLDIESPPPADLLSSKHIVLATNCVHATHSLAESTRNIRKLLRPDGVLMMLEMTQTIPWIDLVFGLIEGWWLFNDGRRHALQPPEVWDRTMRSVGYGHVDWTDGVQPEAKIQRIIIATASTPNHHQQQIAARQTAVDAFVAKHTADFAVPAPLPTEQQQQGGGGSGDCVLITGATGSLGSHLVEHFTRMSNVQQVVCLNRRSVSTESQPRQLAALSSRGVRLSRTELAKIKVLAGDTSRAWLGVGKSEYFELAATVTHVVHNAWPMSLSRAVEAFEPQFRTMRNLLDLAAECGARNRKRRRQSGIESSEMDKVGFLFVSSIATTGYYPLWSGQVRAPEDRVGVESVLPNGYGDAKLVCEKMLDMTLHRFPDTFTRPMVVRIGQIAGSTSSGYWNPVEHLAFLIKSSQTVRALPNFKGTLSWCPVDSVAATLGDLLLGSDKAHPVYHIENPARQSWQDMVRLLAEQLDVSDVVPFSEWLERVRSHPGSVEDNPAVGLVDFLGRHFIRMSCGDLVLDTVHAREHSETLRNVRSVSHEQVAKYVESWKRTGFLRE